MSGASPLTGPGSRASHEAAGASSPKASIPDAELIAIARKLWPLLPKSPITNSQREIIHELCNRLEARANPGETQT